MADWTERPGEPVHEPQPATLDEVDLAVDLILRQQQRGDRAICYLGSDRDGVVADLNALEPPWRDTLRVVVNGGQVVGAVAIEWDEGVNRAWVIGPWVAAEGAAWDDIADRLLRAVVEQLPEGIRDVELGGYVAHARLARLASRFGLKRSAVSHVLVVTDEVAAAWHDPVSDDRVRAATAEDLGPLRMLHDAEFPGTHTSADVLVSDAAAAARTVLVAILADRVVGYAAGQTHPDGEGYVDYLAVADDVRGQGIGRALLVRTVRAVLAASSTRQVSLTVEDHRAPARRLYEALGFRSDGSIVGYRTAPEAR